jgi:multiple sugar transport system substrate-binding protein
MMTGRFAMTGTTEHSIADSRPVNPGRRAFVRTAAGLAGILAAGRPPAAWAAREISVLTAVNYAPASDAKLAELGKRFTKLTGVNVRIDHIQSVQMSGKLSAELMSKAGHDIVSLEMHYPYLFQPGLADVSDLCNDLAKKHGDWYPFAKDHAYVKGQWLGVPYLYISFPGSHRIDLFEKVGEKAPDTWDDLLRAGRKLKKLGHPVGFAISQTTDSVSSLYSVLWSFGAKDVAADGKTIAIRSKETELAVDYVRALYADAMDPAVLSWDNAANNQWLNSGKGSWIHNPISHYVVARKNKMPVAEQTGFHLSPAGPGGRHTVGVPRSLGLWKFSKNQEPAKEFLRWFFEPAQYHEWILSGDNYNHPMWRDMENHPVWDIDPKYKPIRASVQYSHLYGWPAPPDERTQLITNTYVIPNMFARVVTNASSPKDAILWAENEIKRAFQ